MSRPAVFVVDDQASFRQAARAVIEAAGCDVLGEATTADEAIAYFDGDAASADLVLIDVNLGRDSGITLTRSLTTDAPEIRIVLVSTMAQIDLPTDAATAGAVGFVEKSQLDPVRLRELVESPPSAPGAGTPTKHSPSPSNHSTTSHTLHS